MQALLEQALLALLRKFITADVVKSLEQAIVDKLKAAAAQTDSKIDDEVIAIVAAALGLQA